jgi:hypothetical protein
LCGLFHITENIAMKYSFKEFTIDLLVSLIDDGLIDLNPDYQRNYIWSPKDQMSLIDTILRGFPLPNFFLYQDKMGKYEMVDGQQRSKTIYRFVKGQISSSKDTGTKRFVDVNKEEFNAYRLPMIVIENLSTRDYLRDFYVLINKKGVHLNLPEVNKSEHFDKLFLKLSNEVLDYQGLIDLNLFSEISKKRMNDRAYIEEILGYLKQGIKEKKKAVESIYKTDISEDEYSDLKAIFYRVIDRIVHLNNYTELRNTRYKQKNDFYTLFSFVHQNLDSSNELLLYQYKVLLILDGKDSEGLQFIRPTNEDSYALKSYAINCVSQSNSSSARENRLSFFNSVLKNTNIDENEILKDVLNYLSEIYGEKHIQLSSIESFNLVDVDLIEAAG